MARTDTAEGCINASFGQVMINFGSSKADLSLKYRLGLEYALSKADFLNAPDIVLVQAFALFLCLVRRHDSPRFVWMMTGLVIRMAQYLGLQRDGTHFEHLTPFEVETRRKVWWVVCMLDVRASEDQGTDLTIASGSFDTKIPLNINDTDIDPESKHMPLERDGVTDMSFARISFGTGDIARQMMILGTRDDVAGLEEQSRLLSKMYQKFEEGYFPYMTDSGNISYWVGVTIARLVMAKMTLIVFLPVLFSSPSDHFSDEIRIKLLVSAIEVAEYNHALNTEQACRKWRWLYQTYTHWHAIVYLMIEISRRPWSPVIERAWIALHSSWLIPAQNHIDKNLRIWVPLRRLMDKARQHRNAELNRLRADPPAAAKLEIEDRKFPLPSSSGSLPAGPSADMFRERWRLLVEIPEALRDGTQISGTTSMGPADLSMLATYTNPSNEGSISEQSPGDWSFNTNTKPTYLAMSEQSTDKPLESTNIRGREGAVTTNDPSDSAFRQTVMPSHPFSTAPVDWPDGSYVGFGAVPWLWADDPSIDVLPNIGLDSIDINMDLSNEVNWYNWIESTKDMESNASAA